MQRLSERAEAFPGLIPQALNNTNITGRYVKADIGRRLRAVLAGGAMATTKTSKLEIFQATDAAGSGAKIVTGASAEVTSEILVNECTVDLTSSDTGDIVTINGIAYTDAAADDIPAREFSNAAGLVLCVNNAAVGVPGVAAVAAGAVVTLYHDQDEQEKIGPITLVCTDVAGTLVEATTKAQAVVDVDLAGLDKANSFLYIAAKVTTTANTVVAVHFDFYDGRYAPVGLVGASAVV